MALERSNDEDFFNDFDSGEEENEPVIALTKTGRVKKVMDRSSEEYARKVESISKANEARRLNALKRREDIANQADEIQRKKLEADQKAKIMEETRQRIIEQELEKQAKKYAKKVVKQALPVDAAKMGTKKDMEQLRDRVEKKVTKIEKEPVPVPIQTPVAIAPKQQQVSRPVPQSVVPQVSRQVVPVSQQQPVQMTQRQKLASLGF